MATKKQKRERALAKREAEMAKIKAEGLEALRRSREYEAAQRERAQAAIKGINDRHEMILSKHGIKPGTGIAYDKQEN